MLLDLITQAVNKALQYDEIAKQRLRKLAGKVLALEIEESTLKYYVEFHDDEQIVVTLTQEEQPHSDVVLSGTAIAFIKLMALKGSKDAFSNSNIRIAGDIELGQALQQIAASLDLDIEGMIAEKIGDYPARKVSVFAHQFNDWRSQQSELFKENLGDYIKDEKGWAAQPLEFEQFSKAVDELRADFDRLAARIDALLNNAKK